jgi:hypothetical protein
MKRNNHPSLKEGLNMASIVKVIGREILDSRGNPTAEVKVFLESGQSGKMRYIRPDRREECSFRKRYEKENILTKLY